MQKVENFRSWGLKLSVALSLALVLLLAPVAEAARWNDTTPYYQCNNRSTVKTIVWSDATMKVYRCSNGSGTVFAHLSVKKKRNINVQMWRTNPSGYQIKAAYAFAVTTPNMLAIRKGACYTVRGYTGSAKTYKFCYY